MRNRGSYHFVSLVGILGIVAIFSSSVLPMLPTAVFNQHQPPQSAFATVAGEHGKIAFISQRDGGVNNPEIYVMNADGSEQTNISNNSLIEGFPDWSPDGTKIVFTRFLGGNEEIYVMNADGSGEVRLTNNRASDIDPNWSPDGTKILFFSDRDGYSPSGNTNYEIYVMNADGSEQTNITTDPAADTFPDWSPDGTKIAFASNRASWSNEEIYVMNADGSNPTRITFTDDTASDSHPSWSPDGTKIAFASNRDVSGEIYVMNPDGSNIDRLTFTESAAEDSPSWSPDGTKIAFASNRDERTPDSSSPDTWNWEIYIMNADGSEQTRLTTHQSHDYSPSFGPATETEPPEEDTIPPVLTAPDDIIKQATTANGGTVVTYNVTAEDNVDGTAILEEDNTITQDDVGGDIDISCDPASGTEFPIGDTLVECTATDSSDNVGEPVSFTVTILPPQPEPLTADISSNATAGDAPTTFEFEAAVTGGTAPYSHRWDFGDGNTEESIEPTTSHTYDEPGTYTATLTVIDSEGQEATDSLEVTVNEPSTEPPPPPGPTTPREAIEDLISFIQNLQGVPEGAKTGIVTSLERALALLSDDNSRNDASACNMLGTAFINQVNANERRDTLTEDQAADLRTQAEDIRDMLGC